MIVTLLMPSTGSTLCDRTYRTACMPSGIMLYSDSVFKTLMSVLTTQWEDANMLSLLASYTPGGQGISVPDVKPEDFETFADWIDGSVGQQNTAEIHPNASHIARAQSFQSFIDNRATLTPVQNSSSELLFLENWDKDEKSSSVHCTVSISSSAYHEVFGVVFRIRTSAIQLLS